MTDPTGPGVFRLAPMRLADPDDARARAAALSHLLELLQSPDVDAQMLVVLRRAFALYTDTAAAGDAEAKERAAISLLLANHNERLDQR